MKPEDREPISPAEWEAFEDELLDRAKEIARRIVERVRRVTGEAAPDQGPRPDDQPGEVPVFG